MSCGCTDKKKIDYDYVRKLANAESITKEIDIQIYFIIGFDGKTKYYDYEPTIRGRKLQVVETIQFQQYKGSDILPITEQSRLDSVSDEEIAVAIGNITGSKIKAKRSTGKPTTNN